MANICENTLRVYSENSENLKCIENFFKDLGDVERVDDENLEVYFDSKWRFPEEKMDKLYMNLPDKSSINMNLLPRSDLKGKYPRCHYNKLGKAK